MEKLIIAFATDDGQNLSREHFGEAKKYIIYEITKVSSELVQTITNISPEEKMHGDPNKAKGVAHLLKPFKVKVLVNKAFGRNIVKMQQKFVVVLSQNDTIEKAINAIQKEFETIATEWEKGEQRDYLRI
jgi:predicted Fe-Mo cluster-binding NifX family protein